LGASFQRTAEFFLLKHLSLNFKKIWGWDSKSGKKHFLDSGFRFRVKKALDPGSGSATPLTWIVMFYDPEKARSKVDQDCDLDFLVLWIRIQLFYIKTELDFDLDAGEQNQYGSGSWSGFF
jgi:hypothetical protein